MPVCVEKSSAPPPHTDAGDDDEDDDGGDVAAEEGQRRRRHDTATESEGTTETIITVPDETTTEETTTEQTTTETTPDEEEESLAADRRRPLPRRARPRPWRDGHGPSRAGRGTRPEGRDQAPFGGAERRRDLPRALHARGAHCRGLSHPTSSACSMSARTTASVHRHGVRGRRTLAELLAREWPLDPDRAVDLILQAARGSSTRTSGARPPRHQAAEPARPRRRHAQDRGLRDRPPRGRHAAHTGGDDSRNRGSWRPSRRSASGSRAAATSTRSAR